MNLISIRRLQKVDLAPNKNDLISHAALSCSECWSVSARSRGAPWTLLLLIIHTRHNDREPLQNRLFWSSAN